MQGERCDRCQGISYTIIEDKKLDQQMLWRVGYPLTKEDVIFQDNSLVMFTRNGKGYLAIVDRYSEDPIPDSKTQEIECCPFCGHSFI